MTMDELEHLVVNAETLLREGHYDVRRHEARSPSLLGALGAASRSSDLIAEIKFASPIGRSGKDPAEFDSILSRIAGTNPLGLSILTEPRIFRGHIDFLRRAAHTGIPVLMKDVVIDSRQIAAAASCGAAAVLLIEALVRRGLLHPTRQSLIDEAHSRELDVVLEVHTLPEWDAAIESDADILGINNRDLATMEIDVATTPRILADRVKDRPVIAMSGIETRAQVDTMLRAGADAVLVGTSIMRHEDPAGKLEELQGG
jgi:indole-3-glycerol phosphate synthase